MLPFESTPDDRPGALGLENLGPGRNVRQSSFVEKLGGRPICLNSVCSRVHRGSTRTRRNGAP
jgi:hypothetical protein